MRLNSLLAFPTLILAAGLAACTAEVEDRGEPPQIDVEPGRAPDVDIQPADIDITTDTQQVVVPDVDINERDTIR